MEDILEKINKAGLKFLAPLSLTQTYEVIAIEAARLLQADWASLYLVEKRKLLSMAAFPDSKQKVVEPRLRGYTYRSYLERKTFIIHRHQLVRVHPELENKRYKSAICIPISDHKKSIGALMLLSYTDQKFSTKEKNLLKVFGSYATLAIRKAQLFEKIEEAVVMRDHFISLAAHELRTPLTSINGYIQLLASRMEGVDSREARWVKALTYESGRLTDLIGELLEINRLKTGQLHFFFKEVSVQDVLDGAIKAFHRDYPERELVVRDNLDGKGKLIADSDKLSQVVKKLLDNAVKFSPPESKITLGVKKDTQYISLEIIDEGQGIAKEDISRIFEGFYKAHNTEKSGMGVGLLFVKYVVAFHKGIIDVQSKKNKGTVIRLKLPVIKGE